MAGEASIGNCVNSLQIGCDCMGHIHYLDHVTVKPDGDATGYSAGNSCGTFEGGKWEVQ